MMASDMKKWLVGVDEAGRGPLAGPVAVGVVVVEENFDWELVPYVNDSKKLSEKRREEIFKIARRLKATGHLDYAVSLVSAKVIDKIGIVPSIALAQARAFKKLPLSPKNTHVKLDGGLKASIQFSQETIIQGDAKEKVIGLASIMAKVTRDRHMVKLASRYPEYAFGHHKGYGTDRHRQLIVVHGVSEVHRNSFCTRLQKQ